jgi:hypothetical protein
MTTTDDHGSGLFLTDMTCALPSDAWVADAACGPIPPKPAGDWRVLDYTCVPTRDDPWSGTWPPTATGRAYSGRMLTTCLPGAVTLRIPLGLRGWHAVSLGIAVSQFSHSPCAIEVRLTGDTRWERLSPPDTREEPWIMADLTGRDLEIRPAEESPSARGDRSYATLMSVRAVPMAPDHVRRLREDPPRPLVYLNDGHGLFWTPSALGPELVTNALSPFADSDWTVCCFGGLGDLVVHPGSRGTLVADGAWDLPNPNYGFAAKLAEPLRRGWDPLKQAVDLAHAQGQDFWYYLRPQGWLLNWPYDQATRSRFVGEHLNLRCIEADGKQIAHMSFAYPEVRRQLTGIVAEAVERGADGFCIALVRGWPWVRYEEPVRERFRQLYGGEARERPDTDPELRRVWRSFVAEWLRELRAVLDGAPNARGKRRCLSVICGPTLEWNLRHGLDVAHFAREKLLDAVMPYPYGLHPRMGFCRSEPIAVGEYAEALRGTETRLLPSLGWWKDHAIGRGEYYRRAHAFYRAGADGLSRWDTRPTLARMGLKSPARAALWAETYAPDDRRQWLLDIGGMPMGPFTPWVAG